MVLALLLQDITGKRFGSAQLIFQRAFANRCFSQLFAEFLKRQTGDNAPCWRCLPQMQRNGYLGPLWCARMDVSKFSMEQEAEDHLHEVAGKIKLQDVKRLWFRGLVEQGWADDELETILLLDKIIFHHARFAGLGEIFQVLVVEGLTDEDHKNEFPCTLEEDGSEYLRGVPNPIDDGTENEEAYATVFRCRTFRYSEEDELTIADPISESTPTEGPTSFSQLQEAKKEDIWDSFKPAEKVNEWQDPDAPGWIPPPIRRQNAFKSWRRQDF